MNYTLAKELEDAGYKGQGCDCRYLKEDEEQVYAPTLFDLIEECDDNQGFGMNELRVSYDGSWQKYWIAEACPRRGGVIGEGKTPEEAVARLWLALNKDL